MNTIIFCTSYINESNCKRYTKWMDYYSPRLDLFNSSKLFLIDDGSPYLPADERMEVIPSNELPQTLKSEVCLFHFEERLGRISVRKYPGWWRSFTFSIELARKYNIEKIIHIESDFYIVSRNMIDYITNLTTGWTTFYCRRYKFPETAIQVICKDAYDSLYEVYNKAIAYNYNFKKMAEYVLPFTHVEKQFYGDRFGEQKVLKRWLRRIEIPGVVDYIGQLDDDETLEDYRKYFRFDEDVIGENFS